jgi:hypothetical protein
MAKHESDRMKSPGWTFQRASAAALLCASFLSAPAVAAPTIEASGYAFGDDVVIQVRDLGWAFQPATRYARDGNTFNLDVEFDTQAFGPFPPGAGDAVVRLGALGPGLYTVRANVRDAAKPGNPTLVVKTFSVDPPRPGVYTVPRAPQAQSDTQLLLASAINVDSSNVRVAVAPGLIRVDFQYLPNSSPTLGSPAGYGANVLTPLAPLPAGRYRIEAWGAAQGGGKPELYFTNDVTVAHTTPVVEFYSPRLDHYFIALGAEDVQALDSGAYGDWKRTGQQFSAWMRQGDAFPGSRPVCRFYAPQQNSHFFTIDNGECEQLKSQEKLGREAALASKQSFQGWQFEKISFFAMATVDGACSAGTRPVYRFYNDRAAQNDANHRFIADEAQAAAMTMDGWKAEGIAFCSPW